MRKATATVILIWDTNIDQYTLIEIFFNTSKRERISFDFSAYFETIDQVNECILDVAKNNGFYIPVIDTMKIGYMRDVNYIIVPYSTNGGCGLPWSARRYTKQ